MSVQDLQKLLESVSPGRIQADLVGEVVSLLSDAWNSLSGTSATAMAERKISSARVEELTWEPPFLSFVIERHGGTVQGSKFGELQAWRVDLDHKVAACNINGRRRLQPFAPKLHTQALAVELFEHIQSRDQDSRLTWKSDTCVRIRLTLAIPDGPPKQTTQGRRRRLRAAITPLLIAAGWSTSESGTQLVFERPVDD